MEQQNIDVLHCMVGRISTLVWLWNWGVPSVLQYPNTINYLQLIMSWWDVGAVRRGLLPWLGSAWKLQRQETVQQEITKMRILNNLLCTVFSALCSLLSCQDRYVALICSCCLLPGSIRHTALSERYVRRFLFEDKCHMFLCVYMSFYKLFKRC